MQRWAVATSRVLPMPASPVTRSSPEPDSRWARTTASSFVRPAMPGVEAAGAVRGARGEPQPVEVRRVSSHRLHEELHDTPRRQAWPGEGARDGRAAAAASLPEGPQAGPARLVVEVVERIDEIPVGAGSQVGAWQRRHSTSGSRTNSSFQDAATSRGRPVRSERHLPSHFVNRGLAGTTVVVFNNPVLARGPHHEGVPMITTNTTPARAAIGATIAAICLPVAACGTEQGTLPDRNSHHAAQHAAADDVAAPVEYRKATLSPDAWPSTARRRRRRRALDRATQIGSRQAVSTDEPLTPRGGETSCPAPEP